MSLYGGLFLGGSSLGGLPLGRGTLPFPLCPVLSGGDDGLSSTRFSISFRFSEDCADGCWCFLSPFCGGTSPWCGTLHPSSLSVFVGGSLSSGDGLPLITLDSVTIFGRFAGGGWLVGAGTLSLRTFLLAVPYKKTLLYWRAGLVGSLSLHHDTPYSIKPCPSADY